jgi:hypothetical protein
LKSSANTPRLFDTQAICRIYIVEFLLEIPRPVAYHESCHYPLH